MGSPKGLLKYKKKYWIEEQISRIQSVGFDDIVVVFGQNRDDYLAKITISDNVSITSHSNEELGPTNSIQHAINHLQSRREFDGIILNHIDRPVPKKDFFDLIKPHLASNGIVRPIYKKICGHPIFFNQNICSKILNTPGVFRLDSFIKDHTESNLKEFQVPNWEVSVNFNTKDQWLDFLNKDKILNP